MGISLSEYAKAHPMELPEDEQQEMQSAADAIHARAQKLADAEEIKNSIIKQLERGEEPQIVLYAALKCIGLYSGDSNFIAHAQGLLDLVYGDLLQQSLLTDDKEEAAERIRQMQQESNDKLRRSIERQQKANQRIEKALAELLAAVNAVEPAAETENKLQN